VCVVAVAAATILLVVLGRRIPFSSTIVGVVAERLADEGRDTVPEQLAEAGRSVTVAESLDSISPRRRQHRRTGGRNT
jgi:hypothetical protein